MDFAIASYIFLGLVCLASWKLGDILGPTSRRRLRQADQLRDELDGLSAEYSNYKPVRMHARKERMAEWLTSTPELNVTDQADVQGMPRKPSPRPFPRNSNRRD